MDVRYMESSKERSLPIETGRTYEMKQALLYQSSLQHPSMMATRQLIMRMELGERGRQVNLAVRRAVRGLRACCVAESQIGAMKS